MDEVYVTKQVNQKLVNFVALNILTYIILLLLLLKICFSALLLLLLLLHTTIIMILQLLISYYCLLMLNFLLKTGIEKWNHAHSSRRHQHLIFKPQMFAANTLNSLFNASSEKNSTLPWHILFTSQTWVAFVYSLKCKYSIWIQNTVFWWLKTVTYKHR